MVLKVDRPALPAGAGAQRATKVVHIHIGEHYVSNEPGLEITTVLGSCIGACIRDPRLRIGGMNHFMLPGRSSGGSARASNEMRYGQFAMEQLINDLLAAGARRERLEVKLFGGANTLDTGLRIGDRNVAFARAFFAAERMPVAAVDLGGSAGRRIRYMPTTGKVLRLKLDPVRERSTFTEEIEFGRTLAVETIEGTVELFE